MALSKHTKIAIAYGVAGAATLIYSTVRAGAGKSVWPGLGSTPPGAGAGAFETVAFWPLALWKMHELDASSGSTATSAGSAAGSSLGGAASP